MNAGDILLLVDDAFYSETGKRLNDLQRAVIAGVLNHQKYADIAEELNGSEGHVKDVGYELLKLLSSAFEEPVTKANLKSVLERQKNLNFSFGSKVIQSHIISYSNIHFEPSSLDQSNVEKSQRQKTKIQKLRDRGFSDEEIAEILEIPLELLNTNT
ncbi:MAG: hypothetical protein GC158_15870 [Cyanobacteria bacterium RI_101]|nr:hypothetical protein [Cyanobacteria bacterium RI_101]